MSQFRGMLPALVTPLQDQQSLNESAFVELLARLYRHPIAGVYVAGQTGEGLLLSLGCRKRLAELAVRHSPSGKTVIVHVGAPRLEEAIDLARHAAAAGAHAVSSLPPAGLYSFAEVLLYYRRLAAASSLPFFVYYFPGVAPAVSSPDQLLQLCTLPNVVGLKFTDYDLYGMSLLKEHGITVFYGRDEMVAAGLLFGADGGIGTFYNLLPGVFTEIYRLAQSGDWERTKPLQRRVQQLIRICQRVPMLAAVKRILTWQGVPCGSCVEPRLHLTGDDERVLRDALEAAGFLEELGLVAAPRA
jgi:N-acetylneuraminate lyase